MNLIIMLLLAAFLLIAFEVILPGGILGVIAAVLILVASILTYTDYGIMVAGTVFLGALCLSAILVLLEFKLLSKTTMGSVFFLKDSVTGHTGPECRVSLVGKRGESLTRLNPGGKVLIEGKSYDASSQDGYLDPGEAIAVVAQNNFKLTIRKL